MESTTSSKRPSKRRRTKGVRRLVEGDDALADGIAVKTTIRQTPNGPVEDRLEVPIWKNKPPPARTTDTHITDTNEITIDNMDFPPPDSEQAATGNSKTQAYYIQEFVDRVDPMLKALLSREALPAGSLCGRCIGGNIAAWRCRDCTAARVMCRGCMRNCHIECPTHRIEVWTGTYFRSAELWEVGLYILIPHHTDSQLCTTLKFQQERLGQFQGHNDKMEQERLSKGFPCGPNIGRGQQSHGHDDIRGENRSNDHDDEIDEHMNHPSIQQIYDEDEDFSQFTRRLDNMYRTTQNDFNNHEEDAENTFHMNSINADNELDDIPQFPADYMPDQSDNIYAADPPVDETEMEDTTFNPHYIPKADALNNQYVRVVHTNGVHHIALVYCSCRGRENIHSDLVAAAFLPTSFARYRTVFTHAVLDDFRLSNLECKASAYQYFQKLRRQTSPMSPDTVPDLYHELRRMSRLWRWMKKLKWAGVHYNPQTTTVTNPGQLANFCPACPQPGINLSADWSIDPRR